MSNPERSDAASSRSAKAREPSSNPPPIPTYSVSCPGKVQRERISERSGFEVVPALRTRSGRPARRDARQCRKHPSGGGAASSCRGAPGGRGGDRSFAQRGYGQARLRSKAAATARTRGRSVPPPPPSDAHVVVLERRETDARHVVHRTEAALAERGDAAHSRLSHPCAAPAELEEHLGLDLEPARVELE